MNTIKTITPNTTESSSSVIENCINNNNDNSVDINYEQNPSETCGNAAATMANSGGFGSSKLEKNKITNKKEIYMVAEGYHKTDSCYFKTADGGYHKLPPDSYHKMSEICYNKLPDGNFKRLIDIQNADNNCINGTIDVTSPQNKMRNHMIKFLKRSKSHSQASAKESYANYRKDAQRTKDKEKIDLKIPKGSNSGSIVLRNLPISGQNNGSKNAAYTNNNNMSSSSQRKSTHSGNRKVVVTMMENGGLPIVATSKTKSSKIDYKSHHQNSIRDKVKSQNIFPDYFQIDLST